MTLVMSLAFDVCGTAAMSALSGFGQPLANNVGGLVRIALCQFADPVHRLRVDLALDLGNVDQLGGAAGAGNQGLPRPEFLPVGQSERRFGTRGNDFGSQDALDQRADHHEQHHKAEQHHDAEFDDIHDVILGELQHAEQPARLHDRGNRRRFGKAQIDDLDLVTALLVEADRRADQGGDAVELFLAAVLIDHFAFFVLGIGAVDQYRDRDPVDPSGLGDFGLGGAGNLVIVGLFALFALVAGRRPGGVGLIAGQFVVDRHLAVVLGGQRRFLAGLGGAQHAALGIELVRGLGDLVVVEVGGELDAGAALADHRGDDPFDFVAHALLEGRAALFTDGDIGFLAGAVSQQPAGFVDDRHPLRLQSVDGGGDDMADGADLLRFEAAAHPHHDRGRRLRHLAREQGPFRQYQMDAGGLDAVDGADGAGEFTLQRAQMVDVLDEARGAERIGLVENLVADAAALGQVAFGQLHPQPRDLVLWHHDDRAFVA